jgi:hypothetical protein
LKSNDCGLSGVGTARKNTDNQTPAIKMLIGDWQVDELGILTREIRARD